MEEVTVKEICASWGYTESSLAKELGVSVSLISKIQNAQSGISDKTQELFQAKFPGFKLVNGTYRYKDLYEEALEDLKEASNTISNLEAELLEARTKLAEIGKIINERKN